MIVKHYRTHSENWEGGFSRNRENDEKALAANPLPSDTIILDNLKVNGHEVSYKGKQYMIFRTDSLNRLIAFEGHNCKNITIDGVLYQFAEKPFGTVVFSKGEGPEEKYFALVAGEGKVLIPIPFEPGKKLKITTPDNKKVNYRVVNGQIELVCTPEISGKKLRIEFI